MKNLKKYLPDGRSIIMMLLLVNNLVVQAQPAPEYQLKSAFLFNFAQFVEWPKGSFPAEGESFIIGILGENPFQSFLEELVAGEKVNGHPVTIRYYRNMEEIKTCHILFISQAEVKIMEKVTEGLKNRSILTVSDAPNFMNDGGMIKFLMKDNKIKIQINPEASKAANLIISSKLLRLAEIFSPKEK